MVSTVLPSLVIGNPFGTSQWRLAEGQHFTFVMGNQLYLLARVNILRLLDFAPDKSCTGSFLHGVIHDPCASAGAIREH